MCVCGSPGARASSGGPGREMSRSDATLGGERRESPPLVTPGDGGGTPFFGIDDRHNRHFSNRHLIKAALLDCCC